MRRYLAAPVCAIAALISTPTALQAQAETHYVGDIILVSFNFCPKGWARADGTTLRIDEHTLLFQLIGSAFGGDSRVTFGLPDLRGRVPVHTGTAPGLSTITRGLETGTDSVTLTTNNMQAHRHFLYANSDGTNEVSPANHSFSNFTNENAWAYENPPNTPLNDLTVTESGESAPVDVTSPSLAMTYCIALQGIAPSRP